MTTSNQPRLHSLKPRQMTAEESCHSLTLESCQAAIGEASIWVRRLAAQYGVDAERAENLDLCANELVSNIVDYAYAGVHGKISLELNFGAESVKLVVVDAGPAFNPLEFPTPDLPGSLETAKIGGFGIHLVRKLVDGCCYERHNNHNRLTLCFGVCARL